MIFELLITIPLLVIFPVALIFISPTPWTFPVVRFAPLLTSIFPVVIISPMFEFWFPRFKSILSFEDIFPVLLIPFISAVNDPSALIFPAVVKYDSLASISIFPVAKSSPVFEIENPFPVFLIFRSPLDCILPELPIPFWAFKSTPTPTISPVFFSVLEFVFKLLEP